MFDGTSETEPKDAGSEKSSGVVRLNTIRQIIEQVIVYAHKLIIKTDYILLFDINVCTFHQYRTVTDSVIDAGQARSPGCYP